MTNTPRQCPKCGCTLAPDAPEGLCPACLMAGALPTDATIKLTPSQMRTPSHGPAAPPPEELAPLFPQLEIIELLGRGGMGAVYKARQPKLNRFVALKIIAGDAAADPHFAERFQREAQALAKLNHPNIVSVFDFGETGGLFYFLMEFVDGANLRTLMQSGEMKPEAALALIPAFCDALQYAHDEGVVHRDIKPENVLVDKKGRLKIADFGLAKLTGSDAHDHTLTRTGMYLGTPRYMAPEQVEKPETVDHRADIYSLGVVFYEMLTGELPMGRFDPPSKKVDVDVKLDDIVLRSLEKDVDRRYQHASEIKSDVQSVADGGVVQASPHVGKASVPAAKVGVIPAAAASPKSMSHSPALLAQIDARSIEMMIAGIALVIGGLFGCIYGMTVAADYASKVTNPADNVASRAVLGALMHLSVFLFGIAAFISSLGVRKLRWHPFALVMSILLMLVLPGVLFAIGLMSRNDLVLLQFAYPFYAGLRAFLLLRKPAVEAAFAAERDVLRPASPPSEDARLSRMALIGAIWAFLGIIAVIPSMMLSQTVNLAEGRPSGLVHEQPPAAFTVFMAVLLFIGAGAPIGTTILGAISMSKIKKSGGKLYGLPLAFADTVFFPLLLLHGTMAVMLGLLIITIMKMAGVNAGLGAAEMGLLAMLPLIADFFIARALWRKVTRPAGAPVMESRPANETPAAAKPSPRHFLSALLVLLCLFGFFFGFGFQAKHSGSGEGLTKIITVGALDPLYTSESGPWGFRRGLNFFSWSFFAVVVAGITFSALWRIGREDQGKVPRDPAWWRDWWKQVGVWGGLLLIVCTVRTVMHPEKVLRPLTDNGNLPRLSSGTPLIVAEGPGTKEPDHYLCRYKISAPPDHRVVMWMEVTREGKPVVLPGLANQISIAEQLHIGEGFEGSAEFSLMDGSRISPDSKGKWRWDFKFSSRSMRTAPGGWIENPFEGKGMRNIHLGPQRWQPRPGETVSIMVIRAGHEFSGIDFTQQPPAGEIELRLKARIDLVPLFHRRVSHMSSTSSEPYPAPEKPLGRIAAGFGIDTKLSDEEIRRALIEKLKTNPDKRADAEAILKSVGKPITKETTPEDVLKAL
ncbi:MAG: serine/threonine protein kinase [Verrucomicrobiaceae bacterium]|nr:serine/threonine protein kinase [Verrucomicrobiaceae bacterium]